MRRTITFASGTLLLLADAAPLLAEERILDGEPFDEMPIVLTATRLSQPINEAPISTSVIDKGMIIASGARNVQDLFRLIPGLQVFYSDSNYVGVTAHGLDEHSSKRMQVLINGRSVYLPTTGGVPWNDLPLTIDDVEQIEVVRGPNAASYGANAFLGVINIITKHSVEGYGTSIKSGAGYNDEGHFGINHGGSFGDLDYRIGVSGNSNEGFIDRHDGRQTAIINGRIDYQITPSDTLFLEAGLTRGAHKSGKPDSALNQPHIFNSLYNFQQLQWDHIFSQENLFNIQFSHSYYEIDENFRAVSVIAPWGDVFADVDFDYYGHRYDSELTHHLSLGSANKLAWGAGARRDIVQSAGYLGTNDELSNDIFKLFGNLESHLTDRLVLNTGVMYESNEQAGEEWSPKIGLLYHATPGNTLRLSFSKASRNPVLYEEFADADITACLVAAPAVCIAIPYAQSTGAIKSEVVRMGELGWHYTDMVAGLQLDIRYFHMAMRRMIGSISDTYQNLDQTTTEGVEFEGDFRPFDSTRIHLSLARAITDSTDLSRDGIEAATPANTLSLLVMQSLPYEFDVSANYYYMDEIHGLGTGDDTGPIDRLDIRLAKSFTTALGHTQLAATLQNASNQRYQEYEKDNLFERRLYLELNHSF